MNKLKLLFVCNANLNRSITFEHYFSKEKYKNKYEVKSAGTLYGYPNVLNEKLLTWADVVYVMDMEQWDYIRRRFGDDKYIKKIKIIGISDQYNPDDRTLINLIEVWEKYLMED